MTRLLLRSIDDAPNAAKERLVTAEKRNGFLPNLLRILSHSLLPKGSAQAFSSSPAPIVRMEGTIS
jgi:hypothetical protein